MERPDNSSGQGVISYGDGDDIMGVISWVFIKTGGWDDEEIYPNSKILAHRVTPLKYMCHVRWLRENTNSNQNHCLLFAPLLLGTFSISLLAAGAMSVPNASFGSL
jgi:hypothetical protein